MNRLYLFRKRLQMALGMVVGDLDPRSSNWMTSLYLCKLDLDWANASPAY